MGMPELIRDIHRAVDPDSVNAPMAAVSVWLAAYMAAMAMVSSTCSNRVSMRCRDRVAASCFSASRQMVPMASTASAGCLPTAVSAESMTASVPSSTALATSKTSARVGTGFSIMDSIIWVAVTTTRLRVLARLMSDFCTAGSLASLISTPRSPLAIMIPSDSRMMVSACSRASARSILAMTEPCQPYPAMISRHSSTSAALRTKESAMKSAPIPATTFMSSRSFSVSAPTDRPPESRLTPLPPVRTPPLTTVQCTAPPRTSATSRMHLPSSRSRMAPLSTSAARPG